MFGKHLETFQEMRNEQLVVACNTLCKNIIFNVHLNPEFIYCAKLQSFSGLVVILKGDLN